MRGAKLARHSPQDLRLLPAPRMRQGRTAGDCGDDDDVYYYIRWRLELEGETENSLLVFLTKKNIVY